MYTVVIASQPDSPFLEQAVESIGEQTLLPDVVYVVLDVDAAPSGSWLDRIRQCLPNLRVIHSQGSGMIPAMNCGISISDSAYIAFLDADDLWLPNKQAQQIQLLQEDPQLDAATCLAANFSADASGALVVQPAHESVMFTSTTFRSDAFDRFGQLDPGSTHFTWLYRWWGQARMSGIRTAHLPSVGTYRRLHADNSWRVHREQAHRELLTEVRRHAQSKARAAAGQSLPSANDGASP